MHKNVFKEMQKKPMFEIRIICCLSLSMFNAQKKEIAGKEIKGERKRDFLVRGRGALIKN